MCFVKGGLVSKNKPRPRGWIDGQESNVAAAVNSTDVEKSTGTLRTLPTIIAWRPPGSSSGSAKCFPLVIFTLCF